MSETHEISTTTTPTPEANSPEARTATGEIRDVNQPITTSTEPTDPKVDPKPIEGEAPKTDDDKPVVPDVYQFTVPDGVTLDAKLIEEATPIFKELGLTTEQAQKLVNIQIARDQAMAKAGTDAYNTMRADWTTQLKADPDIGTKLDTVKATINRGYDAMIASDPKDAALVKDFKAAMDLTGAGDHPAVIKLLNKVMDRFTEGSHVTGNGPSPHGQEKPGAKPASVANALYPNLP